MKRSSSFRAFCREKAVGESLQKQNLNPSLSSLAEIIKPYRVPTLQGFECGFPNLGGTADLFC